MIFSEKSAAVRDHALGHVASGRRNFVFTLSRDVKGPMAAL
jgi:hypothetical protein